MLFVPRIGNAAKAIFQQSVPERTLSIFATSRKKRRDDCLDVKKSETKQKKEEVKSDACVDLNFKKREVFIYDYDDCLPPRVPLDKDCSTVKAKKVSCNTKKRNVPTGCRKYSVYTDIQRNWSQGTRYRSGLHKDESVDYSSESEIRGCPKSIDPLRVLPKPNERPKPKAESKKKSWIM